MCIRDRIIPLPFSLIVILFFSLDFITITLSLSSNSIVSFSLLTKAFFSFLADISEYGLFVFVYNPPKITGCLGSLLIKDTITCDFNSGIKNEPAFELV